MNQAAVQEFWTRDIEAEGLQTRDRSINVDPRTAEAISQLTKEFQSRSRELFKPGVRKHARRSKMNRG